MMKLLQHPGTLAVKEQLKQMGARWDGVRRGWNLPEERYDEALALCGGPVEPTPAAPVQTAPPAPVSAELPASQSDIPPPPPATVVAVNSPVSVPKIMVRQAAIQCAVDLCRKDFQTGHESYVLDLAGTIEDWILR